ncbi:hypothetical protein [Streptomyces sp. NPDC026589]|uniref:hypothetical protein n=1 Tax=Streptomyces sp. NPDC026589 TaxID=3155609 RepID=UPI00340391D5
MSVIPLVFTSGWVAAVIAAVPLVLGIVTVLFLASRIRRFPRRRAQGRAARREASPERSCPRPPG